MTLLEFLDRLAESMFPVSPALEDRLRYRVRSPDWFKDFRAACLAHSLLVPVIGLLRAYESADPSDPEDFQAALACAAHYAHAFHWIEVGRTREAHAYSDYPVELAHQVD